MTASQRPTGARGRGRLLLMLGVALLVLAVLVAGVVFGGWYAVTDAPHHGGTSSNPVPSPGGARPADAGRDEIAAAPMLQVDRQASLPTTPAAVAGPTMQIPPASGVGPAGVPSGFPRTPENAVGQLAAIGIAVLQGMSIPYANDVYTGWALPGGVGAAEWPMTGNVQAFLDAAQIDQGKHIAATVIALPAAAQVKGVDGLNWAVGCVLFEVHATITVEAQMGYGYCERMQWHNGRWMIAPGVPPADAPSTWPGSELSIRAGWRTWVDAAEG
jgi:hypothetical protein